MPDADVRVRLLEAGYACVARYGLMKTTVEDVARVAKLSRATVYRYFPGGREQLFRAVVAWEAGRFFERLTRAVAGQPTLAAFLEETLVVGRRALLEHDVLQKVLQTEPERLLPLLTVENTRILSLVKQFLVLAMQRSRLPDGMDADEAADYLARMVLSLVASPGRWDLTDREQVRDLVRVELLGGLGGGEAV